MSKSRSSSSKKTKKASEADEVSTSSIIVKTAVDMTDPDSNFYDPSDGRAVMLKCIFSEIEIKQLLSLKNNDNTDCIINDVSYIYELIHLYQHTNSNFQEFFETFTLLVQEFGEKFYFFTSILSKENLKLEILKSILTNVPAIVEGVYTCKKCQCSKIRVRQKQTRSADEAMTTFLNCAKCNNIWVEN